jgi:hypothetical protein
LPKKSFLSRCEPLKRKLHTAIYIGQSIDRTRATQHSRAA